MLLRSACVRAAALAVATIGSASAPQEAGAAATKPLEPGQPRRVLVYTVSAGFEHDVAKRAKPDELCVVERALVDLGKRDGWFEAVPSRDAKVFEPASLATFDLVFFYTTGELPLSKGQRDALFDFVKKGGAFAGSHCATDTFYEVPEYGAMIGAYFDGHPWHEKVRIRVEDREHPATRPLGPSFDIVDEIYQFRAPYDRSKLHVLLSLDASATDMTKDGIRRADGDFAIAWCKEFGKGRVFYTALGHRPEVWKDERFLQHVLGGFIWAMRMPDEPTKGPMWRRTIDAKEKGGDKQGEEKEPPKLPLVPDGFAVDLIAQAPDILWPSAVTCLPDGSLLVGEDRMDMPGPVDQPVDRIIRLRWKDDGTFEKTVFAEKLWAVMGLAEVDGDLFVMNMPHLTRLRDADGDGVAEEREEVLTDLGPPAPGWDGPGRFNDHIVSGTRLGMDGFLYIAVGDKGIPGAHGTDGSTIQLRGGGVVRVRPDGSRLEIVASGLRNILDVAIDERGEMFTYDNTDDGLGWWTRLTHIVVGGYYGYPWDYQSHPERMLPCMAEYGGGSPTGGMVYREAAWPEPYHSSLFFCEWGKSALRRFDVEPDGATFKVASAEDFMRAGDVKVFKPFDVCESPDGRFLYVSDWAYEGWTNPKEAGRLWRVRRADDDPRVPSVAKPLPKDVEGLIAALDDPSFNHRLRAQRELARRGRDILPRVRTALAEGRSRSASRHAVWARVAIGGDRVSDDLRACLSAKDSGTRAQVARALVSARSEAAATASRMLKDPDVTVVREAAAALRKTYHDQFGADTSDGPRPAIEWTDWRPTSLMNARILSEDRFVRFLIVRALQELPAIPDGLEWGSDHATDLLPILRGRYEPAVVKSLEKNAWQNPSLEIRAQSLTVLAGLHRMPAPWDGKWWSIQPAKSPPPEQTVEWSETTSILTFVRSSLELPEREMRRAVLEAMRDMPDRGAAPSIRARWAHESDPEIRLLMLGVLAALKDEAATEILASVLRDASADEALRQKAIDTACAIRATGMIDLLCEVTGDSNAPVAHVVPCIRALGKLKEPRTAHTVAARLGQTPEEIRLAALDALVEIQGKDTASLGWLEGLLEDPSAKIRCATLDVLGRLELVEYVPKILPLVDDEATRDEAVLALAATPHRSALSAYLLGLVRKNVAVQEASRIALAAVRDDVRGDLEVLHAKGRLDDVQLAEVQKSYQGPQPILRWRILGPFKRGEEPKVPSAGADEGWIEHAAELKSGFVDLEKRLSKDPEVCAYAAADVASAREREADMAVGSDDMVTVWVNGEKVHDYDGNRGWKADEDRLRVKLRAGANTILLRVGNGVGQWSFNAKISGDPTGPLFEKRVSLPGVDEYRAFALENKGNPAHGFKVFRDSSQGAMCVRCHVIFGAGVQVGPDLSDIAARYSRDEIIASVLEPSQRIAEGYMSSSFELDSGVLVFGMVKKETASAVEVFDTNGELHEIETGEIVARRTLDTSVMPDGLALTLSKEDFADLIGYLSTLRGAPGAKK